MHLIKDHPKKITTNWPRLNFRRAISCNKIGGYIYIYIHVRTCMCWCPFQLKQLTLFRCGGLICVDINLTTLLYSVAMNLPIVCTLFMPGETIHQFNSSLHYIKQKMPIKHEIFINAQNLKWQKENKMSATGLRY